MIAPPVIRGGAVARAVFLVLGLALFAAGIVVLLESGLGLSPWDVLNQGLSERSPLSFGMANVAVALVVLVVAWALGARVGPGTVANAVLIGLFVDLLLRVGAVERLAEQAWVVRSAALGGGILVIGLGSAFYIGAGMGAGPRDSLMLVLARRSGTRIGVVRAALEVAVTALGFALGGTVGVGTLAFALGIGPAVELSFWLLERTPIAEPGPVPMGALHPWPSE
jgi:uncharacterized membrane protein YczE